MIHMAKLGCRLNQRLAQRTGKPGETEEEVVQDSDLSDRSVQVPDSEKVDQQVDVPEDHSQAMTESIIDTISGERKQTIKWPPKNNKADWEQFDFDVDSILNTSLAGGKKVEAMTTIMYNVGKEKFGLEKTRQKRQQ